MSVYCQFFDNKQNKISEEIVSNASFSIPANAVAGLFYDNTYKLDGLKLTLNNLTANDFSFDFAKEYFLYVFPVGYSSILATSVRSSSFMSDIPELSQNDIDYLKNLSDNSQVDLSTIVTALNSITSALSALTNLTNLTNLSNLADLANIITAIQNKDNQSDIVDELRFIFTNTIYNDKLGAPYRFLNGLKNFSAVKNNAFPANIDDIGYYGTLIPILGKICSLLSVSNSSTTETSNNVGNKSILRLINSKFDNLNTNINNIETKLEQNLPFTTIVNNDYIDNCVSATVAYNKKIENIPFN